jgi:hypothetical protein
MEHELFDDADSQEMEDRLRQLRPRPMQWNREYEPFMETRRSKPSRRRVAFAVAASWLVGLITGVAAYSSVVQWQHAGTETGQANAAHVAGNDNAIQSSEKTSPSLASTRPLQMRNTLSSQSSARSKDAFNDLPIVHNPVLKAENELLLTPTKMVSVNREYDFVTTDLSINVGTSFDFASQPDPIEQLSPLASDSLIQELIRSHY